MNKSTPSRREFLKATAATGAALFIGFDPSGTLKAGLEGGSAQLNPFVKIASDGVVTVIIKHFEMGQGTTTGLTTLVAEELDADWDKTAIEFAPSNNDLYKNLAFGMQGTGGSTAIANSFLQYRQAGAAAKDLLIRAAAEQWNVPKETITVTNGMIKAGDKTDHFGSFITKAAALEPVKEPKLKPSTSFQLIGNPKLSRKDNTDKTNGTATFAMDVKVPNMVYAVILRSPRFGGQLVSFDAKAAKQVNGFIDAKALPTKSGIAVYATSTWGALQAREAIEAKWDFSKAENRSTEEMRSDHFKKLDQAPEFTARKGSDFAKTDAVIKNAAKTITADFFMPHLAHAPMEPLNCVIEPLPNGGIRLHDGCQFPAFVQPTLAKILKVPPEKVEINTVYAGGSFGRRANPTSDYNVEAALAFQALGGKKAVKLVWSREDDLSGGHYRPMAAHRVAIGLDDKGTITGWRHHIATQSILKGTAFEPAMVHEGVDHTSVEGVADTHYGIPSLSVGLSDLRSPLTVLWWRSVGNTHTAYAMEVALDMAAEKTKKDPIELRLSLLSDGTKDQKRLSDVLKLVREKSGWDKPLPKGWGRGVALHKSFNSYVAQVIEVSTKEEAIKIERVICAVDCGIAVNPDVVKAQMEGGIGFGLGAVMRNQITFDEGEVVEANFPDYEPLRLPDIGNIEVHIAASTEAPTGVGEPGVPPAGPALANAIFAATGKRITNLPMTEQDIEFV